MRPGEFDDNISYWAATAPPDTPCAPLCGEVVADVAIIGGGFTGTSTARELLVRRPALGVVLLEARTLGNGASGRNGGQLLNWINGIGSDDPLLTRRVWDATSHGIERVLERARAGNVRWSQRGALELYTDARRAERAHAHADRLNALGIPVRYVSGAELHGLCGAEGVAGGVLDPTGGVLSGVDLLRATRPELIAGGARIYEGTPVTRVHEGELITLDTPQGIVRAKALVLATNAYTHLLGYFRGGVFPLLSHVVSVPMAPGAWGRAGSFSDDMDRISYGAHLDGHMVFGGGSNASYAYRYGGRTGGDLGPAADAAVRRKLGHYFPGAAEPSHRWTGALGITLSRRPSIGRRGNVYWGLGYSGHGVTLANLAGEILADLYTGDGEKWVDLPIVGAPLGWIPPDPFRWVGYHAYTAMTGRSPRRG
ncbi:MAG: FAD-dependent oxidoreductase [Pseudomonadota bacterium]|nr:FAD-dependent oxidoreductase [Pseudomonadota bacterium]